MPPMGQVFCFVSDFGVMENGTGNSCLEVEFSHVVTSKYLGRLVGKEMHVSQKTLKFGSLTD